MFLALLVVAQAEVPIRDEFVNLLLNVFGEVILAFHAYWITWILSIFFS